MRKALVHRSPKRKQRKLSNTPENAVTWPALGSPKGPLLDPGGFPPQTPQSGGCRPPTPPLLRGVRGGPYDAYTANASSPRRRGGMDVTKPYKFIGFGAMDVTKPDLT